MSLTFRLFRPLYSVLGSVRSCVCCGSDCFGIPVCTKCKKMFFLLLQDLKNARCSVCGRELISERKICMECRRTMTLLHTDTMHPIFRYELWNKNLVYEWKIHGRREFAPFFAELIHCALDILGDGSALPIVPVPPRKGKMRLLGWDQIDDICCELHCKWGYSIYRMLIRDSPNQQKSLGKQERIFMSRGQYHLKSEKEIKKITKGEIPPAVILLDDVITTGATIECCAECLKKAGIKKVHGVTLFAT